MSSSTGALHVERPNIPPGHEIVELRTPSPSGASFLSASSLSSSPFKYPPLGALNTPALVQISEIRKTILEGVQEIRVEVRKMNRRSSGRDSHNKAKEEHRDRRDRFKWSLKTILEDDIVRVWPSGPRRARINFQLKMFLTGNKFGRHDVEAVKAISQRIEAIFKDITSKDSRDMVLLLAKQAGEDRKRPVVLDDNAKTVELEIENAGFDITGVNATRGQFCITLTKKGEGPQISNRRASIKSRRKNNGGMINVKPGPVESAVSPCGEKTICRVGGSKIMGKLICCSAQTETGVSAQAPIPDVVRHLGQHVVDRKGKNLGETSSAAGSQGPQASVSTAAELKGDGIGSSSRPSRARRRSGFVTRLDVGPLEGELSVNVQDTITNTSSNSPSSECGSSMSNSPTLPDLIQLSPGLERFPCFDPYNYNERAAVQGASPPVPEQDRRVDSQVSGSAQPQAAEALTARQKEKLPQRGSLIDEHSWRRLPSLGFDGAAGFARDAASSYDERDHNGNNPEPDLPKLLSSTVHGEKSSTVAKSLKEILAEIDGSNRDFQQCVSRNLKASHTSLHATLTNPGQGISRRSSSLKWNALLQDTPQQSIVSFATTNKTTNGANTLGREGNASGNQYISRAPVIGARGSSIGKGKAVNRSFVKDTSNDSLEHRLGSPLYEEVMSLLAAHDRSINKNPGSSDGGLGKPLRPTDVKECSSMLLPALEQATIDLAKAISRTSDVSKNGEGSASRLTINKSNSSDVQDEQSDSITKTQNQNSPMSILGSAMQAAVDGFAGIYRASPKQNVGGSATEDTPKTPKKLYSPIFPAIFPVALAKQLFSIMGSVTKKGESELFDKGSADTSSREVGANPSNAKEKVSKKRTRSMVDDSSQSTPPNRVLVTYHGSPVLNSGLAKRQRFNSPTDSRSHAAHNYTLSRKFRPNGFLRHSTRAHPRFPDGPENPFLSSGTSASITNRRSFFLKRMRGYTGGADDCEPEQQPPGVLAQGGRMDGDTTEDKDRIAAYASVVGSDGITGPSTPRRGQPIGRRRILAPKKPQAVGSKFTRKFMI